MQQDVNRGARHSLWIAVHTGTGRITTIALILFAIALGTVFAQSPGTGVSAQAIGQANLRAAFNLESQLVGEIAAGADYPVLGRNARYPWLLLGDVDSAQPIGWVFEALVVVRGDISRVPFSDLVIAPALATAAATATIESGTVTPTATALPPSATATIGSFGVYGRVRGEVNIRYGPGVEYPRAGVAYDNDRFEITGYHTQFPWVRIAYAEASSGQAWIARELLDISGNIFNTTALSQLQFSVPPLTPTPPAIRASGSNSESGRALSGAFLSLANELWNLFLANGFDPQTSRFGALFVMDLGSGEAFTFGDEFAFSGTSLNKIAILGKLYEQLSTPPSIETATDILNTMICSENAASNRLLSVIGKGNSYIGAEAVTTFYQQLAMPNSFLTAPFTTIGTPEPPPHPVLFPETEADQEKAAPDLSNQSTVTEIGSLLANVYACAYADSGALLDTFGDSIEGRECRQMLHVMSNNTVDALLKSGVPADTRVAHKHGWIPDTHGNAAVFFTPGGDYVIAMMLFQPEWLNFQESLPLFSEVSRRVYNFFNPQRPQLSDREWIIPDVNSCNYFGDPLIADLLQWTWDS